MDAPYPMQRLGRSSYVSAAKNVCSTMRAVSTFGSYDYVFSYERHEDGAININVRASSYIQAAYFSNNHEYGHRIHDGVPTPCMTMC